jgi:hypothetical protein
MGDEDRAFLRRELARAEGRVLPCGAFAGWDLRHVPREYLEWAAGTLALPPRLRAAITEVRARPDPRRLLGPRLRRRIPTAIIDPAPRRSTVLNGAPPRRWSSTRGTLPNPAR